MKQEKKDCNVVENILVNVLERLYIKRTNDFFQEIKDVQLPEKITELELQCEGYGLFKPDQVLKNFFNFITRIAKEIRTNNKLVIRTLKINLSGFKFSKQIKYIEGLYQDICSIASNIKTLWIHTSDLQNMSFNDFRLLFKLIVGMQISKNRNFEDFSLQCANWAFAQKPPTFNKLQQLFKNLLKPYFDENGQLQQMSDFLYQKHIRLQISGWWYTQQDAKTFLQINTNQKIQKDNQQKIFGQAVKQFHDKFQMLINQLLQILQQIQYLQIDMRNNHELLQTKKLKQKLISNVTKTNRSEKSLISMRQKKISQGNQGQQNKSFRFNVMM